MVTLPTSKPIIVSPPVPPEPRGRLWLNLGLGAGILALIGMALTAPPRPFPHVTDGTRPPEPPAARLAPASPLPGAAVSSLGAAATIEEALQEVIPLRVDLPAALAIHPDGEIVCTATGGDLEMKMLSGDFRMEALRDGGFRVRPSRAGARGEAAAWCRGEMFTLRLRVESGAPRRRQIWLSTAPPTAVTGPAAPGPGVDAPPTLDPSSTPQLQAEARLLLDELVECEFRGPTGDGAGEFGQGEREGLAFHWRRAIRRGAVCGAVLDLTNKGSEPYFFEPSSLGVKLPDRGAVAVLMRSGEGLILPGHTQPAIVIWHEPIPPGTAPAGRANVEPPTGPYTLALRPWPLPWRELAAVITAATTLETGSVSASRHVRKAANHPAGARTDLRPVVEQARHSSFSHATNP